jgi:hypothetical protein
MPRTNPRHRLTRPCFDAPRDLLGASLSDVTGPVAQLYGDAAFRNVEAQNPKGGWGQRTPLSELTLCNSRGIYGNCPRLPRLALPCGGTRSAIPHNPVAETPPGHDRGLCGRLPGQSQYPERKPQREKKEPPQQRWRVHTCALKILPLYHDGPTGRRLNRRPPDDQISRL